MVRTLGTIFFCFLQLFSLVLACLFIVALSFYSYFLFGLVVCVIFALSVHSPTPRIGTGPCFMLAARGAWAAFSIPCNVPSFSSLNSSEHPPFTISNMTNFFNRYG